MKRSLFITLFLSALLSCTVPKNYKLDKTFSEEKEIHLSSGKALKLDFELQYNSSEAKNKPSLELGFKKDGIRISYGIKSTKTVKASKLKKISKNAFLQLELYNFPIEEQLQIKAELHAFNKSLFDIKSKADKLIKSNKEIEKLDIIKQTKP